MSVNAIYLDYAATTPVDRLVAKKMQEYLIQSGVFGNPSSSHSFGIAAMQAVEEATQQVADLIHSTPEEIIWTSGATEANNLAIKGVSQLYQCKGKHIVTMSTEHKSVLEVCAQLAKNGYMITYLPPSTNGRLDLQIFSEALRPDTILVSIMQVNNETGVIQDIEQIAQMTAAHNILLHVDAAQSAGKIPINVSKTPIDLLSLCAHKLYGPKGIGALYVRKNPRIRIAPQIQGGEQQQGMRAGTLPTHQIVGMGAACYLAKKQMSQDYTQAKQHQEHFLAGVQAQFTVRNNSPTSHSVPHILNICLTHQVAHTLLARIPHIAAATAAACQGSSIDGSYVLRSIGLTTEELNSAIRFSFGRYTTSTDITIALMSLQKTKTSTLIEQH